MGGNRGKLGGKKRGGNGVPWVGGGGGCGLGWCVMILIDVRTRWLKAVSLWQKKNRDPPILVHGPR